MKKIIPFPDKARIDEQAAAWLVRLDRGSLDSHEQQALASWLESDPAHRQAFDSMAQTWGGLECMGMLATLTHKKTKPQPARRLLWIPAGAVAMAMVVMVLTALYVSWPITAPGVPTDALHSGELVYQTEKGQRSEINLRDGSVLSLNTQSEVRIRFDSQVRALYLTRGEAHFKVAKNAGRPFVVHAGSGLVRAVGTEFNVRLSDHLVEVVVSEGVVEVVAVAALDSEISSAREHGARSATVSEGGSARYSGAAVEATLLPIEKIEQRLAWRKGKWMFEGETLQQVLDEVSRYSERSIVIADPNLAGIRVGGYFDIGDIDGLMNALQASFGIEVVRKGDELILHGAEEIIPQG